LAVFRRGQKPIRLERPAILNDGIVRLSAAERESLSAAYGAAAAAGRAMEFVPASGAATRMFKGLTAVLRRSDSPTLAALAKETGDADSREFHDWFQGMAGFPFRSRLDEALRGQGRDLDALIAAKDYRPILEALLSPKGLRYSELPKALIPFHLYPDGPRTALEEHLAESAGLVGDTRGVCRLHFTVSPDHEEPILALLEKVRGKYEAAGLRFEIGLSQQRRDTDTLAVGEDNGPARNLDNTLVLRPGGHGALLENLYRTGGDIVFIKNIDNLVPDRLRSEILAHRRSLGGYLVHLQERIFAYLRRLGKGSDPGLTEEIAHFAEQRLGIALPEGLDAAEKAPFLLKTLDRPLRVCAMVRNQGEPGGGPFWVRYPDGALRLQIVEAAQVDPASSQQRKIAEAATHFNPVDLVCGLRNHRGELFKLQDYVDTDAFFITSKSKDGKTLKALELPGLWNGSMAFWNTVFVETPVETFNPVKTVNDLLRPSHRA
jgi:hypothetical protein